MAVLCAFEALKGGRVFTGIPTSPIFAHPFGFSFCVVSCSNLTVWTLNQFPDIFQRQGTSKQQRIGEKVVSVPIFFGENAVISDDRENPSPCLGSAHDKTTALIWIIYTSLASQFSFLQFATIPIKIWHVFVGKSPVKLHERWRFWWDPRKSVTAFELR